MPISVSPFCCFFLSFTFKLSHCNCLAYIRSCNLREGHRSTVFSQCGLYQIYRYIHHICKSAVVLQFLYFFPWFLGSIHFDSLSIPSGIWHGAHCCAFPLCSPLLCVLSVHVIFCSISSSLWPLFTWTLSCDGLQSPVGKWIKFWWGNLPSWKFRNKKDWAVLYSIYYVERRGKRDWSWGHDKENFQFSP